MEFVQSTLFSNIIAVIALLVAIGSFVYTFMSNRPSIEMSDYYLDELYNNDNQIKFGIILANTSSKTIVVKEIRLINGKGVELSHLNIETPKNDYLKYRDPYSSPYSCYPLQKPEVFIPNAKLEFSYHLNEKPAKVEIITDKRIKGFSKKRNFNF